MSINIQAKTNYSFLFSGLSSSASNALSGNWLADYASIKNGSYGKLMKAYYAKDSGDSKTAASTITKKDTATDTAKKALAKVETTTDALKESADALLATGKKDLFTQKDITTKDENGVESTTKGYDTDAIYSAVNSFVTNYNSVMAAVDDVKMCIRDRNNMIPYAAHCADRRRRSGAHTSVTEVERSRTGRRSVLDS